MLGSLESLSLGDTNVGGNLESLSPVTTLVSLNLRYTKTCGDLKVTAAFPSLERLDLTGVSKVRERANERTDQATKQPTDQPTNS